MSTLDADRRPSTGSGRTPSWPGLVPDLTRSAAQRLLERGAVTRRRPGRCEKTDQHQARRRAGRLDCPNRSRWTWSPRTSPWTWSMRTAT